jgi:hypothetical protein
MPQDTTYLFRVSRLTQVRHWSSVLVESVKDGIISGCGSNMPACLSI